ncbi:MAG: hypothetical protein ABI557_14625 [Aureliella sp.]
MIARYFITALLIAAPGLCFVAKAFSMHLYRQHKYDIGVVVFDVPENLGMPIDTYIRWMLVFSAPFIVLAGFVLYRLAVRLRSTA